MIFPVCSLTKAVTAAAVGILVDEGKLTWDMLVKDVLPTFHSKDETLQNFLTVTDLLSHRPGMAWADTLVMGTENNILILGKDRIKYINTQRRLLPFQGQFSYNNLPYDLTGNVVEQISGQSRFEFLQTHILDPLGLGRTFLKPPPPGTSNITRCYNTLDDATTPSTMPQRPQQCHSGANPMPPRLAVTDLLGPAAICGHASAISRSCTRHMALASRISLPQGRH